MKTIAKYLFLLLLLLVIAYLLGPRAKFDPVSADIKPLQIPLADLDQYVAEREDSHQPIKAENEAQIIWADSIRQTEYALVYLHGFSASQAEGDPVHRTIAKKYGMNLYLARLAGHGFDDIESFADLQPQQLIESGQEAIAIGQLLGKKVILMSCSTGSTVSMYLAAENPDAIAAQVMYSPNLDIANKQSKMLTWPWGLQIARLMMGGNYRNVNLPDNCAPYWTLKYRLEGVVALRDLVNQTMTEETFRKIKQPYLAAYWYENEDLMDKTISIDAIKRFDELSATPADKKLAVAWSSVGAHCMASPLQSKDVMHVIEETSKFLELRVF